MIYLLQTADYRHLYAKEVRVEPDESLVSVARRGVRTPCDDPIYGLTDEELDRYGNAFSLRTLLGRPMDSFESYLSGAVAVGK